MPGPRGLAPTMRAQSAWLKISAGSMPIVTCAVARACGGKFGGALRRERRGPAAPPQPGAALAPSPHLAQQGVQRVLQLHGHALERLARALAAQQLKRQRLVLAVHLAGRQLQEQGV